ncbi:D-glycerate dehydrogenase [Candidatus Amesbacteria bacterium]|nr:D-glycerate dehydrogenase [Candidatus Amesbacteria bacterium]
MKILVTYKIPFYEEVVESLKESVTLGKINDLDETYGGMLCLLTDKITKEVLDKGKNLKIIANYAVGYDNIDVEECKKRNILVTNTPCDEVNEAVSEFTWSLILALARQLEPAANFAKNVGYRGWEPDIFIGTDLKNKTLGVIGAGRIGSIVATKAAAFGMKVITHSRTSNTKLEEVILSADVVSLHVPLTPETRHMINSKTIFKSGAILINTARGPVVDESGLLELLQNGSLAGAALDVWENEPYPRPELIEMPNVILTPHIASATKSARLAMGKTAVANLVAFSLGQTPPNLI